MNAVCSRKARRAFLVAAVLGLVLYIVAPYALMFVGVLRSGARVQRMVDKLLTPEIYKSVATGVAIYCRERSPRSSQMRALHLPGTPIGTFRSAFSWFLNLELLDALAAEGVSRRDAKTQRLEGGKRMEEQPF